MLLYPLYKSEEKVDYYHNFEFLSGFDRSNINLMVTALPIINRNREDFKKKISIEDSFKNAEEVLIKKLSDCFKWKKAKKNQRLQYLIF